MKDLNNLMEQYVLGKKFHEEKCWSKYLREQSEKMKIIIYGAGLCGQAISKWLKKNQIDIEAFCDSNEKIIGQILCDDKKCISFDELEKIKDRCFVIVAVGNPEYNQQINQKLYDFKHIIRNPLGITIEMSNDYTYVTDTLAQKIYRTVDLFEDDYSKKIYLSLLSLKFQNKIMDYPQEIMKELYTPNQYIVPELYDYELINSVIDCGAYIGDSIEPLLNVSNAKEYHAFEMDQEVYRQLEKNVRSMKAIYDTQFFIYNKGVGKSNCKITYESDLGGSSSALYGGSNEATIVRLDDMVFNEKIDFIKMDIEGSEEDALEGARKLIERDKPVLAISIYHNLTQFIEIPNIIKSIDRNYRLYIRHHKCTIDDTVLYGIYREMN